MCAHEQVAKQTSVDPVSYQNAVRTIVADQGVWGVATRYLDIFGKSFLTPRGLPTRLLSNGLQGVMFTVLWKAFEPWCIAQWTGR